MQFSDKDLLTIVVNFGRLVDQRTTEVRFVADSALEGDGFEPSVPLQIRSRFRDLSPSPF